jgi:hypothetical protein
VPDLARRGTPDLRSRSLIFILLFRVAKVAHSDHHASRIGASGRRAAETDLQNTPGDTD